MRHTVNPQQGRLFDPFEGLIPPLGLERIRHGWQGVFRTALLELMPAQQLGKHFSPNIGRHTKELYSVAGLLFLQEFQNWTIPQAVEAYLFHTDVQFALNLEPGRDEMCDRTFERYRAFFSKTKARAKSCRTSPIASSICSNSTSPSNAWIRPTSSATWLRSADSAAGGHHQAVFDAGQTPSPGRLRGVACRTAATLCAVAGPAYGQGEQGRRRPGQEPTAGGEDMRDLVEHFADHAGLRDRPSYQALLTVFTQQCEMSRIACKCGPRPARLRAKSVGPGRDLRRQEGPRLSSPIQRDVQRGQRRAVDRRALPQRGRVGRQGAHAGVGRFAEA